MHSKNRFLSREGAAELKRFLSSPERPKGSFSFHELQGFLFAIASSPETIAMSEWLPVISNDADIVFENEREAQKILKHIMALYNEVNSAVLDRSDALPTGVSIATEMAANFNIDAPVSQWSRGFITGHDWLSEVWEEYLFDEMEEEYSATLMVLSFFGSRSIAEEYYAECAPNRRTHGDTSFEEFAGTMSKMFPDALASYANLGRTIFEVISRPRSDNSDPVRNTRIGRNEPCPCGSGKKYKKCCGGRLH